MPAQHQRALVILSGGQDSTTCLYWTKQRLADEVHAVTFDYGQRHRREVEAAKTVAKLAGVKTHEVIEVGPILRGTSPLVSSEQQVEAYVDAKSLPGGIEKTFVPMRNALFLTLAFNRAVVLGCSAIVIGVSQEDYGGYPDCRAHFLDLMDRACNAALGESVPQPIGVYAPLLNLTKNGTVVLASELTGCLDAMAFTHTCYNGSYPPCGTCHACLLRDKGFTAAGIPDPLIQRAINDTASAAAL